ncbi:hypothetical protein NL30_37175 [Burkholderia contaminans]|nr:hypothetical protein NL30_37175 [Burkholderia contaminans]
MHSPDKHAGLPVRVRVALPLALRCPVHLQVRVDAAVAFVCPLVVLLELDAQHLRAVTQRSTFAQPVEQHAAIDNPLVEAGDTTRFDDKIDRALQTFALGVD